MIIGDCENVVLYNNFHSYSLANMHFINQGKGGPQNLIVLNQCSIPWW